MARKLANKTIANMLGGYRWIEDSMPVSSSKNFIYNKFNNVYIAIPTPQQAMIQYYNMKKEETNGKAIFVIKLDECQVVKGQRVERTSLTLMSRALKRKSLEGDTEDENEENTFHTKRRKQEYYGVQSERNIWWQAAWALPHEDHDSLRWYFTQTGI